MYVRRAAPRPPPPPVRAAALGSSSHPNTSHREQHTPPAGPVLLAELRSQWASGGSSRGHPRLLSNSKQRRFRGNPPCSGSEGKSRPSRRSPGGEERSSGPWLGVSAVTQTAGTACSGVTRKSARGCFVARRPSGPGESRGRTGRRGRGRGGERGARSRVVSAWRGRPAPRAGFAGRPVPSPAYI